MWSDTRLEEARIMLVQAENTADESYAEALLREAQKNIAQVLEEF